MESVCLALLSASDLGQEEDCVSRGLAVVLGTLYRLLCIRIMYSLVLMCQAQHKKRKQRCYAKEATDNSPVKVHTSTFSQFKAYGVNNVLLIVVWSWFAVCNGQWLATRSINPSLYLFRSLTDLNKDVVTPWLQWKSLLCKRFPLNPP